MRRSPPLPDVTSGADERKAGNLATSGFARLISSGLLSDGRAALRQRLCGDPAKAALLIRLGDMFRGAGELSDAATHYARAAVATDEESDGEPSQMGALSNLLAGHRDAAMMLPDGRVPPFLIDRHPLPAETVEALLRVRHTDGRGHTDRAGVGAKGRVNPRIRDAATWKLPAPLRAEVRHNCGPFAKEASRRLLPQLPEIRNPKMALLDYPDGGGYRGHRDVGVPGSPWARRVLSMILYLDIAEDTHTGGDLLIHDRHGNAMTRIPPRTGMAVIFPANTFHEVTRLTAAASVNAVRRTTLTLWYSSAEASG